MIDHITIETENKLTDAFKSGYDNAMSALVKLIGKKTEYKEIQSGFYHSRSIDSMEVFHANSISYLITTDIIGEINGKSYLFLSDIDFKLLTYHIPPSMGDDIKTEFIKELDNILSAAVITKLSNQLALKMYGDIPKLKNHILSNKSDLLDEDLMIEDTTYYINAIQILIPEHPEVSPTFVWSIDCNLTNNQPSINKS